MGVVTVRLRLALAAEPGLAGLVRSRKRRQPSEPALGASGQAVIDRLLATLADLEPCEHDMDGFALWISVRPRHLLCGFCYQAAQVLAGDIRCSACAGPAGDPGRDAAVIARLTEDLGAHFYLCQACADGDLSR